MCIQWTCVLYYVVITRRIGLTVMLFIHIVKNKVLCADS